MEENVYYRVELQTLRESELRPKLSGTEREIQHNSFMCPM